MKIHKNTNIPSRKAFFSLFAFFALTFALILAQPSRLLPAYAEEAESLGSSPSDASSDTTPVTRIEISPVEKRIELDPGAHYVGEMTLQNTGTREVSFSMEVSPFTVSASNNSKNATQSSEDSSATRELSSNYSQIVKWITTSPDSGTLAPGEFKVITYTIDVPKDVPGGGQYAMIYVNAKDATGSDASLNVTAAAGTGILAKVSGTTREEGEISDIRIPSFLLAPPISATFHITNTGNLDEPIRAIIKVENYFTGTEISNTASNPLDKVVFPETDRDFELVTTGSPRLGLYKVTLTTDYLNDTKVNTAVVAICPLWLIVVFLLMIGVIVFSIVMKITSNKKSKKNSRNATGSSGEMQM